MAANKTKPTDTSVMAFVAALPEQTRRTDAKALIKLMSKASGEKATMWGPAIIGFGTYHHKYDSGREGDTHAEDPPITSAATGQTMLKRAPQANAGCRRRYRKVS
jgi:hypothetical protein